MARLCGSGAPGSQEDASAVVGSAIGSFAAFMEAASKRWWAQWKVVGSSVGSFVGTV